MRKPELEDFGLTKEEYESCIKDVNRKKELDEINNNEKKAIEAENRLKISRHEEKWARVLFICYFLASIGFVASIVLGSKICSSDVKDEANEGWFAFALVGLIVVIIIGIRAFINFRQGSSEIIEYKNKYDTSNIVDESILKKVQEYQYAIYDYNKYLELQQKKYWLEMSGFEFERAVADLYTKMGYYASVTKATGDGGVDIILRKDGERIAVQCKHHARPISPNDFRALIGTVVSQGFDRGIFVSLNGFTPGVITEKRQSAVDIELVDLFVIIAYSRNLANEKFADKKEVELTRESKTELDVKIKKSEKTENTEFFNKNYNQRDKFFEPYKGYSQKDTNYPQTKLTNNNTTHKNVEKRVTIENYDKYLGAIVRHNKFGMGYITEIGIEFVTVKFVNGEKSERKFLLGSINKELKVIKFEE